MIRELSPELQEKAIQELNEDPNLIEEHLRNLREWILQHPHLNGKVVDDQWLLSFLRGSKFDLNRAKEKLENFYKAKKSIPHFMGHEDPSSPRFNIILDANIVLALPRSEDSTEPQCVLFDYDRYDATTMDYDDLVAVFFMILSILIIEDDNCVISGVKVLANGENFPYRILHKFTPNYIKTALFCFLKAYPLRLKGICFMNMNSFMETVYQLLKTILPSKIKERMSVVSKNNYKSVYEYVPQRDLPKEYGGDNGTIEELGKYWKGKIEFYANRLSNDGITYNEK